MKRRVRRLALAFAIVALVIVLAWVTWAASLYKWQREQAGVTAAKEAFVSRIGGVGQIERVTATESTPAGIGLLVPPRFEFKVLLRVVTRDGRKATQQVDCTVVDGHESVVVSDPEY